MHPFIPVLSPSFLCHPYIPSFKLNDFSFTCNNKNPTCMVPSLSAEMNSSEVSTQSCFIAPWIAATVSSFILLPVGCIGGILMTLCVSKRRRNEVKSTSNPFYDYITPQDRDIATVANKCYRTTTITTKAASQPPQSKET